MNQLTSTLRTAAFTAAVTLIAAGTPAQDASSPPAQSTTPTPVAMPGQDTVEPVAAASVTPIPAADGAPGQTPSDLETERAALDHEIDALSQRLDAAEPGSAEADAVDEAIVAALDQEQPALDRALRRLHGATTAAQYESRWAEVELHGQSLDRLVRLRRRARDLCSETRRHAFLSFGPTGFDQAARELRTVSLKLRYFVASRKHSLDEVPRRARDLFTVGAAVLRLLLVAAVLVAALWIRGRWKRWLERLRSAAFRSLRSVGAKRLAQRLFGWLDVIAPWALFLGTIAVLRRALGPAAEVNEIRVVLVLLTVWACYRLAIDVVATLLVNIALHYGLDATDDRRTMLLRSIRGVLRVATLLVLVTLVSRSFGQGVLSSLVMKFAWVVVLVAIAVELFRWRHVMIETFLALQPTGRLADTLRMTRSHWYGALLAPFAFLWLAGRGIATVTREFAMRFEKTQRALAFIFRQRVQRQAERLGYAEGDVTELPEQVISSFEEDALEPGPMVVQNLPGFEELHEILTAWRESGSRGSYLLTGERGIGKTTWLNQLRREDLEVTRIALGRRVATAGELCARLSELLEIEVDTGDGARELGRALCAGPRRIVVLDMAQHLFLANIGGYDAFAAFAGLVNRTCKNVFWLCSMSAYAWRHLRAVRPDATVFRSRRHLTGWSDEQITELIRTRCAASGARFDYTDLVVDRLEGVSATSRLIESEEGYTRLLWDYADGNPRAALHFFLRSLDPSAGKRIRVRLFKAPDVEQLEAGGQEGLFVLAAIVTHESISLEDLERVTRYDRVQCFIHLDRLLELGAISRGDEMYRITTEWHRAAVRLLRRRNLLPE